MILTYAMSCFRLPSSIVTEIEKACSNFWWGVDEGRKRLHWKTWKYLSSPKCMGGMGFRYLESFNKALLAKKIWRIFANPDTLVARALKERYFKHQDVMKATLGSNPSFIWQSLMWSRQLLNKGLCWRICDGSKIETFHDTWIPDFRDCIGPVNLEFETVNTLMQGQTWNEKTIQNLFPPTSLKRTW